MAAEIVDDIGRIVPLPHRPARIVSLIPSITEALALLGAGDLLVGITKFCIHPREIVGPLPKVGGTKNPAIDAIAHLRPDVVIMNSEENREVDLHAIEARNIPVYVSFAEKVGDVANSIGRLGQLIGKETAAAEIAQRTLQAIDETIANPMEEPLRMFCPIWRNPWMSVNGNTYVHDLLRQAGGLNICRDFRDRYPVVDLGDIAALDPEAILLPSEPYRFESRHRIHLAALERTTAARRNEIHLVDGQSLTWYGPRTARAIVEFHELFEAIRRRVRGKGKYPRRDSNA